MRPDEVCVGDCTGVDEETVAWCLHTGTPYEKFIAFWEKEGRAAGPRRNERLVFGASHCLALPDEHSRGTWHCAYHAAEIWIPTFVGVSWGVLSLEDFERLYGRGHGR